VLDGTSRPLTLKVLQRPRLIEKIRRLIPDPATAHLVPFNTTRLERDLALRLGIPMYGADPKFVLFGSKSGGRKLFDEEGIPQASGTADVRTAPDCVAALVRLRGERPGLARAIFKLDEGVSGMGNAELSLESLPEPGSPGEETALRERLASLKLESSDLSVEDFFTRLEAEGGVVEERLVGEEVRSPSVQARITPLGEVQILSTHDQLLGGASGQSFLGARFPADPEYAVEIAALTEKVGKRLCREGVLGRFALDFLTVRDEEGRWRSYAIEINLRKGGTTAPFLILEFLVHGSYDWKKARFVSPTGEAKFYIGDDHVEAEGLKALTPDEVLDVIVREGLHFDQTHQTGIVFQMLSAVTEQGRVGFTAVGNSADEAEELWKRARQVLLAEAETAAFDPGLDSPSRG
jgi:hypothetical protein